MRDRTIKGLLATQKLFGYQTHGNSAGSGGTITIICCSLRPCDQWGACPRERRRVEGHSVAGLLHLRSPIVSKVELYKDRKNIICGVDLLKEIEALFPST